MSKAPLPLYTGRHSGPLNLGDVHYLWDNPLLSPYGYWHPQAELHERWWFERTPPGQRAKDALGHELKNVIADTAITVGVSMGVRGAAMSAPKALRLFDYYNVGNSGRMLAPWAEAEYRWWRVQEAFYRSNPDIWLARDALKKLKPWKDPALTGIGAAKSGYDAASFPTIGLVRPAVGGSHAARQAISAFLGPLRKAGPYIRNATWAAEHGAPEVFTGDPALNRYYARPTFGAAGQSQWHDIVAGRYGFRFPDASYGMARGMRGALTHEAMTVSLWMGNHARGGNARPDELLGYRSDMGRYVKSVTPSQTMLAQLHAGHLIQLHDRTRIDGLSGSFRSVRTRPLDASIAMGPEYYRQLHREQRLYLQQALPIAGYCGTAQARVMRELAREQRAAVRSQIRRQEAVVSGITRLAAGFGVPVPMVAGAQTLVASLLRAWWAAPAPDLPGRPRFGHAPPRALATRVTRNRGGHVEVASAPQVRTSDSTVSPRTGRDRHRSGAKKSAQRTREQALAWARAHGLYVPPGLGGTWRGTSAGGAPAVAMVTASASTGSTVTTAYQRYIDFKHRQIYGA